MLNLSIRNLRRREQDRGHRPARPMSAERRLALGVDHRQRPKVQKSLFGHVLKEDITGINTLPRGKRDELYRGGVGWDVWDGISPELHRWFRRWMASGGIAFL